MWVPLFISRPHNVYVLLVVCTCSSLVNFRVLMFAFAPPSFGLGFQLGLVCGFILDGRFWVGIGKCECDRLGWVRR